MKNFLGKYYRLIGSLGVMISTTLALGLGGVLSSQSTLIWGFHVSNFVFLFFTMVVLGFLVFLFAFEDVYEWVCGKCGRKDTAFFLPSKYCSGCGGPIIVIRKRKKIVLWAMCVNRHKINVKQDEPPKFCPECGAPIEKWATRDTEGEVTLSTGKGGH